MLEVEQLSISYGPIEALRDVSLTARAGEITALVGANGAGKSSLLRAISGLAPIRAGRIRLAGEDVTRIPPHRRAALGLAHTMEGRRLFRQLVVEENLELAWRFGGRRLAWPAARDRAYDRFPILLEKRATLAGLLSGGQQQMLILSAATINNPAYLLLDEPSLGLSPRFKQLIYRSFAENCQEFCTTILLAEQVASLALQVSACGYVLRQGQVLQCLRGGGEEADLSAAYL